MAGPWSARGADTWSTGGTARGEGESEAAGGAQGRRWMPGREVRRAERDSGGEGCGHVRRMCEALETGTRRTGGVASDGSRHGRVAATGGGDACDYMTHAGDVGKVRTWRGHRRGGTEPPTRAGRRQQTKRQQTRLATERHRTRPDAPYSLPSTPLCHTRRAIILPPKRMPTKASMVGHPIYSEPWVQRLDWTAFASELKESMEASAEACFTGTNR